MVHNIHINVPYISLFTEITYIINTLEQNVRLKCTLNTQQKKPMKISILLIFLYLFFFFISIFSFFFVYDGRHWCLQLQLQLLILLNISSLNNRTFYLNIITGFFSVSAVTVQSLNQVKQDLFYFLYAIKK